jgi:ComF family protein
MRGIASFVFEAAASTLAPPQCAACDAPVRSLATFCAVCAPQVQPNAAEGPQAIAAFVYGGPVARALVRLKYEGRPDLARPLGDLLGRAVAPWRSRLGAVVVVPVPLHAARLAERGFNQSALLAVRVARQLGAPTVLRALMRVQHTAPQTSLDRRARANNVERAFAVRAGARVRGASVLLIDDVRTTGATLDSCARALASGGAAQVVTAVVARAEGGDAR